MGRLGLKYTVTQLKTRINASDIIPIELQLSEKLFSDDVFSVPKKCNDSVMNRYLLKIIMEVNVSDLPEKNWGFYYKQEPEIMCSFLIIIA